MTGLLEMLMGGSSNSDDPEPAALQQNFARNQAWAKPGPYTTQLSPAADALAARIEGGRGVFDLNLNICGSG
jgi:hypothetical protein